MVGANNAATAVAVDKDHLEAAPFKLVAVTAATINLVASADTRVYVFDVAPEMSVQTAGLTAPATVCRAVHLDHW